MTKNEIIRDVSKKTGYGVRAVTSVVDTLFESITTAMASGEKITFAGFGTFKPKETSARPGRNPKTGEPADIPARVVPVFKAGKSLKDAVSVTE